MFFILKVKQLAKRSGKSINGVHKGRVARSSKYSDEEVILNMLAADPQLVSIVASTSYFKRHFWIHWVLQELQRSEALFKASIYLTYLSTCQCICLSIYLSVSGRTPHHPVLDRHLLDLVRCRLDAGQNVEVKDLKTEIEKARERLNLPDSFKGLDLIDMID